MSLPHLRTAIVFFALLLSACLLPGCPNSSSVPVPGVKTAIGALGGGAAAGLIGSAASHGNPLITAGAAALGLLGGGAVGNALDQRDKSLVTNAMQRAVQSPPGTTVPWDNPRTGERGKVTSGVWGLGPRGPCKRYVLTATIEGRFQDIEGCAMQRQDGTWEFGPQR